jgi:hypothetical protein
VLRPYARRARIFFETGTNLGQGVQAALDAGFDNVISVEKDPAWFTLAHDRFHADKRVTLLEGSSPRHLEERCPVMAKPHVFYLDAHSVEENPLLDELQAIGLSPYRSHTILIDDVRMFGTPDWHGLKFEDARVLLLGINSGYTFSYLNTVNASADLLVAEVM